MTTAPETGDSGFSLTTWLVGELMAFAEPLLAAGESAAAASALLANIGWQSSAVPDLTTVVQQGATAIDSALTALEGFTDGADGAASALSELESLLNAAQAVAGAVSALSQAASASGAVPGLAQLGEDLLAWMTDQYLSTTHPLAYGIGVLLTLVTPQAQAPQQQLVVDSNGQVLRTAYQLPSLNLDNIGALLRNPGAFLHGVYVTAGSLATSADVTAMADALFPVIADALNGFGIGANYGLDPFFDQLGLDAATTALLQHSLTVWLLDSASSDSVPLGATFALTGPGPDTNNQIAAIVAPFFPSDFNPGFVGGWDLTLSVNGGAPLTIVGWSPYPADTPSWPGLDVTVMLTIGQWIGASGAASAGSGAGRAGTTGSVTSGSGGSPPGPGAQLTLGLSAGASTVTPQVGFAVQGTVSVDPADFDDGFLGAVLPGGGINVPVSLGIAASKQGWTLQGSVGQGNAIVLATFPAAIIGPLTIDDGQFAITPQSTGLAASATFSATLSFGPLTASVKGLGIGIEVTWPAGGGNAGPFNLTPDIVWPSGVGLAVDASPVTGGGFLEFDPTAGRYLGAVELSVADVSVQGVGVLATRLPGGGWSLVVLADVTGLMVQLGFGIELNGVGVLVGVNRTMNVTSLQALARSGGLTDLMFPADLAANAPRVADELDGVFPSCRGQFVVGPTVQLIWGTDSLVTADLAIYIEFPAPARVAVLGSINIMIPTPVVPVVQLNLDIAGIIDLAAKTLSLDMSLSRSNLAGYPITGQAALRTGWGQNPVFLLAVGGFNPHFSPPAGFPSLARVSLTYGGLFQQVRLSAYLALTSNTFQLGAAVDMRFAAGPAAFTASVSFDALVQFKPFHLELDLVICAAITLDGTSIMSLQIVAHLSGPGPWHLSGKVHFSILFFSFTIPVSATFGSSLPSVEPSAVDVVGLLTSAIADRASWVLTPPSGPPLVIVRAGADQAALHPLGQLVLRQRVVPLELPVDRFGADLLPAVTTLSLSSGGASSSGSGVADLFAPAQFISMTDAQKLSAPSFEQLISGLSLHPGGWVVPVTSGNSAVAGSGPATVTASTRDWDPLVVDIDPSSGTAAPPYVPAGVAVADDQIQAQLAGAVAARQGNAAQGPGRYPGIPLGIGAQSPQYTLATPAMGNTVTAGSWISSHALASAIRPAGLQIVHPSELHS